MVLTAAPMVWSSVNFMIVFGMESLDSRISWDFCSRSSSFSLEAAAALMAEVEGTRCVDGKADSR